MGNPNAPVMISAKEFGSKFQSKREVFLLLTLQCQAYLPKYENVTIYFLKDIISGAKR